VYASSRQAIAIAEQLFTGVLHTKTQAIFNSKKSELQKTRKANAFFLDKTRTAAVKLSHQSPLAR
jgi:hypothetical protein